MSLHGSFFCPFCPFFLFVLFLVLFWLHQRLGPTYSVQDPIPLFIVAVAVAAFDEVMTAHALEVRDPIDFGNGHIALIAKRTLEIARPPCLHLLQDILPIDEVVFSHAGSLASPVCPFIRSSTGAVDSPARAGPVSPGAPLGAARRLSGFMLS